MPFVGCSALFFSKCPIGVMLMYLRFEQKRAFEGQGDGSVGKIAYCDDLSEIPQNLQRRG